jgi:hypothetical protein
VGVATFTSVGLLERLSNTLNRKEDIFFNLSSKKNTNAAQKQKKLPTTFKKLGKKVKLKHINIFII